MSPDTHQICDIVTEKLMVIQLTVYIYFFQQTFRFDIFVEESLLLICIYFFHFFCRRTLTIKLIICIIFLQQTLIKVIETNVCSLGHLALTLMHFFQVIIFSSFFNTLMFVFNSWYGDP